MSQHSNEAKTLVDVGLQVGLDAAEAPDACEMSRYKEDYVLGFVVGRSISESVQRSSRMAGAAVAGQLGARYALPLDRVLVELEFSRELVGEVRRAYEEGLRSAASARNSD
ncbi:DUF2623 family protein [Paraburkholderia sabiae]|uniref:DUF2623 family protein n=1 Tax=Paraburkholderia sabiae TaxID=273251 RepID=A0ABU9QR12_9BURK|nr:DUF2623 family protein [Paraburkholderia sabiae]WJZ76547.1 DUF2623 family protein [Paraburkholderia sabiae]CAD6552603.1 hypothetical protein LMG24235_05099 [Paraburkholderia sabiae]